MGANEQELAITEIDLDRTPFMSAPPRARPCTPPLTYPHRPPKGTSRKKGPPASAPGDVHTPVRAQCPPPPCDR